MVTKVDMMAIAVATNKTGTTFVIIVDMAMAVGMVVALVGMVVVADNMTTVCAMKFVEDNIIIRAIIMKQIHIICTTVPMR